MVWDLRQLDNTDPDWPGALQEPPDLLNAEVLAPDQSCDLKTTIISQAIRTMSRRDRRDGAKGYLLDDIWHAIFLLICFCSGRRLQGQTRTNTLKTSWEKGQLLVKM